MSSTTMLSGYVPPHVDYQPASIGDRALHDRQVQQQASQAPPVQVTLSPAAMQVMKARQAK